MQLKEQMIQKYPSDGV